MFLKEGLPFVLTTVVLVEKDLFAKEFVSTERKGKLCTYIMSTQQYQTIQSFVFKRIKTNLDIWLISILFITDLGFGVVP